MIRFAASDDIGREWTEIARGVGFSSGTMRRLAKSGRKIGAIPAQWRATVDAVPIASVVSIEARTGLGWCELDQAQLLPVACGGDRAELFYHDKRVLIAARQKTSDGFYAYATNQASYAPERLEAHGRMRRAS